MRRFLNECRGGSAIEHAMVLPLWILIFTVMIQMTLIWWGASTLRFAASRAARVAVVQIPMDEDNCVTGEARAEVKHAMAQSLISMGHDSYAKLYLWPSVVGVTFDKKCYDETDDVSLDVHYKMPLVIPVANKLLDNTGFFEKIFGVVNILGYRRKLTAKVTMRNEGLQLRP